MGTKPWYNTHSIPITIFIYLGAVFFVREWDGKYGPTYLVLDLLQKVFYTSDAARESFVELCEEEYVQKVTFVAWMLKWTWGKNIGNIGYHDGTQVSISNII